MSDQIPGPADDSAGLPGNVGNPGNETKGGYGGTGGRGGTGKRGEPGMQGLTGMQGQDGPQGEAGNTPPLWQRIGVGVAILVTALSAIYYATAAKDRLDTASEARARLVTAQHIYALKVNCQQTLVDETIAAQKARSAFSETQAQVTLQRLKAQQTYLRIVSHVPPPLPPAALRALGDYLGSLQDSITATKEQLAIGDSHPYPTVAQIAACR